MTAQEQRKKLAKAILFAYVAGLAIAIIIPELMQK